MPITVKSGLRDMMKVTKGGLAAMLSPITALTGCNYVTYGHNINFPFWRGGTRPEYMTDPKKYFRSYEDG